MRAIPKLGAVSGTAATNLLVSGLGSISGLLLARYLGPSARGTLVIAITWPTFIGTIGNLGLPQATTYWSAREPALKSSYISAGTLIAIGLSLILATVGWFVSPLINDGPTIVWELRRVFLAMPLYIVPGIWVGSLQAARISWWNVARLIQPAIYVPYIVVLQFTGELTLRTAVDAFLISLIVQNIGTGLMAYKLLGFRRARKEQAWALWQYGIRSVTSNLPTFVNSRFDQLLLSVSVSTAALGNYALAVSLSSLAMPAASAFGSVAFPKMAGAAAQDQPEVRRRALIGGIITASAFAIPIAILGPFLIPRAFGPGYDRAITCLLILAPAAVVLVANQINEDLLRGEGRPLIPTAAELFGSLITIVFLLLLVPIIGILGAALASLVSYVAVAFALWYLRQRRKTLPISNEGVDEVTP